MIARYSLIYIFINLMLLVFTTNTSAQNAPEWTKNYENMVLELNNNWYELSENGQNIFYELCQSSQCGLMSQEKPNRALFGSFTSADSKEVLVSMRYGDAGGVSVIYNLFRWSETEGLIHIVEVDIGGSISCTAKITTSKRTILICEDRFFSPSRRFYCGYDLSYAIYLWDAAISVNSAKVLYSYEVEADKLLCENQTLTKEIDYLYDFSLDLSKIDSGEAVVSLIFNKVPISKDACFIENGDVFILSMLSAIKPEVLQHSWVFDGTSFYTIENNESEK